MRVLLKFLSGALLLSALMLTAHGASARDITIKQITKTYSITGRTASEFARSMSRRGPYSFQHRRRAWATAARDLSYQLIRQKTKRGCRVKAAKVRLKITYTMPKVRSLKGVSAREQRKWRRMYSLLNKHEKTHGRFYQKLANNTHRALRRLKPARTCRELERNATRLVKSLSATDLKRNDAFDNRDRGNYRRMARIYRGS